jgi:NAD(P)-dependent dehydrogenase (short-subunit alcohol dehydrogenase family)
VINEIAKLNSAIKATFVAAELNNQASVREAVSVIRATVNKDRCVVINCAGIMAVKEYKKTAEGIELQFATNHIGHFLLTNLFMDKILAAGKGARIVNFSINGTQSRRCGLTTTISRYVRESFSVPEGI